MKTETVLLFAEALTKGLIAGCDAYEARMNALFKDILFAVLALYAGITIGIVGAVFLTPHVIPHIKELAR